MKAAADFRTAGKEDGRLREGTVASLQARHRMDSRTAGRGVLASSWQESHMRWKQTERPLLRRGLYFRQKLHLPVKLTGSGNIGMSAWYSTS
mmetsp:Transcript_148041/g.258201  ORF Transcript_148041/g.258201 Transcript_148041/m.258201 type:complete len:92 (-) Transcript_148041:820-1095(-)